MAPGATALRLPAPKNKTHTEDVRDDGGGMAASKAARVEDVDDDVTEQSSSAAARYASGGVIYPPPELRNIVDKTAQYVARNGIEFESKIKGDATGSSRLAFLNDDDAYNAYYRAKLEALTKGTGPLANVETSSSNFEEYGEGNGASLAGLEHDKAEDEKPSEPEPFHFSADLPSITALDFDIIKLTALFVAKRGRSFASALASREGRSYQFEFLRPTHSLFGFYNRLVEQYRMVMEPSQDTLRDVRLGGFGSEEEPAEGTQPVMGMGKGGARLHILNEIRKRAAWEKWENAQRKLANEEEDRERAAFDEIDWQDFVIAGTVELTEQDEHIDLPPPMSLREVRTMSMAQKRMAAILMEERVSPEKEMFDKGESMQEDDEGLSRSQAPSAPAPEAAPLKAGGAMKIRKDYQPKTLAERQAANAAQKTICPVCGQSVPLQEMDEHVRIELSNPQFREQRRELENRRSQQNALMEGADPSLSLRQFAGRRTDIFGGAAEEEAQRKREQDEARKRKDRENIVWDGHAASRMDTTSDFNKPEALQSEMAQMQKRFKLDQAKTYAGPQFVDHSAAEAVTPSSAPPVHMQGATMQQEPSAAAVPPPQMPPHAFHPPAGPRASHIQGPYQQQQQFQQPPPQASSYGQQHAMPAYGMQHPYGDGHGHMDGAHHQQHQSMQKRTDGGLYGEQEWLQYHPAPIRLVVQLPEARSVSDKCDGSAITLNALPLTMTIGALRDRLQSETLNGTVAASKMRLRVEGKGTTLRQSLAHWNLDDGDTITLQIA